MTSSPSLQDVRRCMSIFVSIAVGRNRGLLEMQLRIQASPPAPPTLTPVMTFRVLDEHWLLTRADDIRNSLAAKFQQQTDVAVSAKIQVGQRIAMTFVMNLQSARLFNSHNIQWPGRSVL